MEQNITTDEKSTNKKPTTKKPTTKKPTTKKPTTKKTTNKKPKKTKSTNKKPKKTKSTKKTKTKKPTKKTKKQNYNDVKTWLEAHVHNTIDINTPEFNVMMDMLKKHPNFPKWKNQSCLAFKITRSKKTKHLQVYIKQQLLNSRKTNSKKLNLTNSNNSIQPNETIKIEPIKIDSIQTKPTPFNPNHRWRIISWVACVKGNVVTKSSEKNKLTQAMRHAIRKQIQIWRNSIGKTQPLGHKCVLCECDNYDKLEVDHFPKTFSQIKRDFLASHINDEMIGKIKIEWSPTKTSYRFQKGEKTNMKWQRYHRIHATYRWLCSACNKKCNRKCNKKIQ